MSGNSVLIRMYFCIKFFKCVVGEKITSNVLNNDKEFLKLQINFEKINVKWYYFLRTEISIDFCLYLAMFDYYWGKIQSKKKILLWKQLDVALIETIQNIRKNSDWKVAIW